MPSQNTDTDIKAEKSATNPDLNRLISHGKLWRASDSLLTGKANHSTGFSKLDEHLPNQGWPAGMLIELLNQQQGFGELSLLGPALAEISQQQWVVLINPPHLPYAPALQQAGISLKSLLVVNTHNTKDELWAMEQALKSNSCGAVLCWSENMPDKLLRRLQLASSQSAGLAFLYRPRRFAQHASPAPLRLLLQARQQLALDKLNKQQVIDIEIIKRPHGWAQPPFSIVSRTFNTLSPHLSRAEAQKQELNLHRVELLNIDQETSGQSSSTFTKPDKNKNLQTV